MVVYLRRRRASATICLGSTGCSENMLDVFLQRFVPDAFLQLSRMRCFDAELLGLASATIFPDAPFCNPESLKLLVHAAMLSRLRFFLQRGVFEACFCDDLSRMGASIQSL